MVGEGIDQGVGLVGEGSGAPSEGLEGAAELTKAGSVVGGEVLEFDA